MNEVDSSIMFFGKKFKSKEALDSYKKNTLPKILGAIRREYKAQNCAKKRITYQEWQRFCLVHFSKQNLGMSEKSKIGYMRLQR